jgi:deoxyadenosine/deoxycytidine kinase
MEQIRSRGRHFETGITQQYLQKIQDSYFEFFRSQLAYPILILEVEHLDFVNLADHYREIVRLLAKPYLPGLHRISMRL